MQIVLGSRGDYSVRAVLHLARHPGRQRRREISQVMDIPDKYLPQILARLVRAGIARSTLGRHVRLARAGAGDASDARSRDRPTRSTPGGTCPASGDVKLE